ncbi:hypothetical protein ESZ53_07315 [Salinibacterium sp. UTAS2018]|uniref:hypothetical protein n=1 Tax=Salinibacterium sp. UTAS2018 TaxID=2508880 RepID=UPI0010095772|nr:hypothetical protein [Salinibacterium sp. UTAS2018]QAV70266.1 hypothetical protein ESZ53_07315 [Salinibacterium sp. UTAS2018]
MNRHAVNDLVDCSLQRWYRLVAEWRQPVSGTEAGCVSCRDSTFAAFDHSGQWPHDLIHSFVETLDVVTFQLAVSLHEERHCRGEDARSTKPCSGCFSTARATVHACAQRHAQDISDVISECAMPRLAAYIEKSINLALNAATRGEWAS